MINVTKTFLPPINEYTEYLNKIWISGQVTNNGIYVQELEKKLAEYLKVPYVVYVSNGTVALQIALRIFDIKGEVITTPFSYVATTNSIIWEKCKPVFVDIDPKTLCIDPKLIEAAITENTNAIMAVHVYGYPCDVNAIDKISKTYNLPVIYDAAHAFKCELNNQPLLSYGNISTLSFHATKLFHTIEGGALIIHNPKDYEKAQKFRSFGHVGDEYFMLGINGKNSEFHAAMGLCLLNHIDEIIRKRKELCKDYDKSLVDTGLVFSNIPSGYQYNYAYYPIIFKDENQLINVMKYLNSNDIFPRRYFYPSLNKLGFLQETYPCPVSEDISTRVLCLPLYHDLDSFAVNRISDLIKQESIEIQ